MPPRTGLGTSHYGLFTVNLEAPPLQVLMGLNLQHRPYLLPFNCVPLRKRPNGGMIQMHRTKQQRDYTISKEIKGENKVQLQIFARECTEKLAQNRNYTS